MPLACTCNIQYSTRLWQKKITIGKEKTKNYVQGPRDMENREHDV
jgi:hypothetical protein